MDKIINWIVKNWDKIPDEYKTNLQGSGYYTKTSLIPDVKLEEHIVVLLLDRQKPSIERCYDFYEERISITRTGKIIWGFDSGCSCPSPWEDNYPKCYSCGSYKEFEVSIKDFDGDWLEECTKKFNEIKEKTKI